MYHVLNCNNDNIDKLYPKVKKQKKKETSSETDDVMGNMEKFGKLHKFVE